MIIYTVKSGDSLYSIAKRYGVSWQSIAQDNLLDDPSSLVVGQTLTILQPETTYTVRAGDTLYGIAASLGVSVNQLMRNNIILGGTTSIRPGQILNVELPPPTKGTMSVNGYAYPFIDRATLMRALPYMTYLTIFTYGLRPSGSLIEPEDEPLIDIARMYGVAPVMHLSTLTEEGRFSNALARQILNDAALRERVIENVRAVLSRKPYVGVDVDFEYVGAENAQAYADFLRQMKEALEPLGYQVWVALAPKVRANQEGILYEGHDYAALGNIADRSLLMTYEWGYTYGPPLAVSPINQVRRVLDYGVSVIPSERIFLGVPNYGYDWPLPYVAGESRARSIGNVEAVEIARAQRAAITFDETAKSPTFRYFARNEGAPVEHEVWFEDARSVQAMLSLVPEYGLYGIGIWNIMRPFPQMWQVLNSEYTIYKVLQ
ncbi:MAG: LysM peptidoglycan-binding domain-containing protein [Ruminococcaceae bacterium]|nr:LysM peptidoglycan-binding domain-containing protein [Oscillospiraceae bacterium]